MNAKNFTHIIDSMPGLVDISQKTDSKRLAIAESLVRVPEELASFSGQDDILSPKGPVFQTALVAATMAVKQTSTIIPFCHPIKLSGIKFSFDWQDRSNILIRCEVVSFGPTGVEMEALTGVSVAALVVYDMCKSVSSDLLIVSTRLITKTGGSHERS